MRTSSMIPGNNIDARKDHIEPRTSLGVCLTRTPTGGVENPGMLASGLEARKTSAASCPVVSHPSPKSLGCVRRPCCSLLSSPQNKGIDMPVDQRELNCVGYRHREGSAASFNPRLHGEAEGDPLAADGRGGQRLFPIFAFKGCLRQRKDVRVQKQEARVALHVAQGCERHPHLAHRVEGILVGAVSA
jgi:hypothetical protein